MGESASWICEDGQVGKMLVNCCTSPVTKKDLDYQTYPRLKLLISYLNPRGSNPIESITKQELEKFGGQAVVFTCPNGIVDKSLTDSSMIEHCRTPEKMSPKLALMAPVAQTIGLAKVWEIMLCPTFFQQPKLMDGRVRADLLIALNNYPQAHFDYLLLSPRAWT